MNRINLIRCLDLPEVLSIETVHMHALHGPLIHCQLACNLPNVSGGT